MLLKWLDIIYRELVGIYTLPIMVFTVLIGFFNGLVDYTVLKDKKLKKEAKLSRYIGIVYVIGGIGLFVLLKLF